MIPPLVILKYLRANILPARLSFSGLSLLSLSLGVGVANVTLLGTSLNSAIAQIPITADAKPLDEKTNSQANVVFVNPSSGNDTTGNGDEGTPWKTIAQALRVANVNTVIKLSTGIYSAETGEVFPLILKPGVSIQGNPGDRGKDIIIQGGGNYLSRSFGGQNITIVGANQAVLTGVTVKNPNPRGYGLWIESSNPVVVENTFTGNTQDGISVSGNAAPTISKNYFERNGANGITIAGDSRAQVRENVFQQTGFGVNIAQNAAPLVIGNKIQNNRSGIVVQANARPILRNNLIQDSKEDGLVAIAQAVPDLGSTSEPGGNEFRNNARYDINANAAKQLISVSGNNLVSNRIAGKVDLNGTAAPTTQNSNNVVREIPANGEITFSPPRIPETTNRQTRLLPSNRISQNNTRRLPALPANASESIPKYNQQPPTSSVTRFPIPSTLANRQTPTNTLLVTPQPSITTSPRQASDRQQLNYVQINPNTIEFIAPQAAVPSRRDQRQQLPILEATPTSDASLLPAPNGNIPISNTRNLRKVAVPTSSTTAFYRGGSLPGGVRYRVVVPIASDRDRDLVQFLAPGAFSTVRQGLRVMQAGVFSSEYNAQEMIKKLNSNGLRAIMEPLN